MKACADSKYVAQNAENKKPPWILPRGHVIFNGGRGGIRTRGLWLRRPTLYPTELPVHSVVMYVQDT